MSSRYSTSLSPDKQLVDVKQHSRDAIEDGCAALKGTGLLLQTKSGRETVGKDLSKTSQHLSAQVKHAYNRFLRKWEEKHPTGSSSTVPLQRPAVFKSEQLAIAQQSLGRSRATYGSNAAGREYASSIRY